MYVHPISTFRLFQEGHLLRNSIAIFALTTLFYFIGAELRLVHELSLFWPLNGVMAGVFARYVWLNRLHYYAICYVAMLAYDAMTTEWGLVSLVINLSNMMFIVTVALLVVRDKRLGKNKYEPVSALRLPLYYVPSSARLVRSVLIVLISGLCLLTGLVNNSQQAC